MNYLQQIVAFEEYKAINPLSAGQSVLWYTLMGINNKCGWIEWFSVANKVLEDRSGLSKTGTHKARVRLKELGLIDFRFNGKKATEYQILPITLYGNSNRSENHNEDRFGNRSGNHSGNRFGDTLNKQDKTKQNKNYYNNKSSLKKSPLNNYEDANADDYAKLEEEILDKMLSEEY